MNSKIAELKIQFEAEAEKASSTAELEALRVAYLGKKGSITELMKEMKDLSPEEKKSFGQEVNQLKNFASDKLALCAAELKKQHGVEIDKRDFNGRGLISPRNSCSASV